MRILDLVFHIEHLRVLVLSSLLEDLLELEPFDHVFQPVVPLEECQLFLLGPLKHRLPVQLHDLHVGLVEHLVGEQAHPEELFLLVHDLVQALLQQLLASCVGLLMFHALE